MAHGQQACERHVPFDSRDQGSRKHAEDTGFLAIEPWFATRVAEPTIGRAIVSR